MVPKKSSSKDYLKRPFDQKCNCSSAFPWDVATVAAITNIEFSKTWNHELYSDVKSQEKIDLKPLKYSRLSNSCRPTFIYNFNFFPRLRSYEIGYGYLVLKIGVFLRNKKVFNYFF